MSYYQNSPRRSGGGFNNRGRSASFGGGRSGGRSGGRRFGGNTKSIDPSRFIKAARPATVVEYTPVNNFEDFAVHELLQRNLALKGYKQPSPIQDQAIPVGLEGKDIVGVANTGTGKTVAFALPMLNQLMTFDDSRALIMAPTRELAQQIEDECRSVAKGSGLSAALLIGGAPMRPQLRDLSVNPRLVIGTPGRIKDHLERGTLKLAGFNIVVLDEVDRMLDMGFIDDMREILRQLSETRQSFFFSATMDHKVRTLIDTFSNEPVMISVKTGDTSDNVEQNIVKYQGEEDRLEKLHELLKDANVEKALVFHETKHGAEKLSNILQDRGFKTDAIHGGKSQGHRQRALNRFKSSDIKILVATDVAARGIDVKDITHVINYCIPQSYEDYVHRIGRAGRAGRTGNALTFVASRY